MTRGKRYFRGSMMAVHSVEMRQGTVILGENGPSASAPVDACRPRGRNEDGIAMRNSFNRQAKNPTDLVFFGQIVSNNRLGTVRLPGAPKGPFQPGYGRSASSLTIAPHNSQKEANH